jgi:5'-3' exonuclease
MDQLIDTVNPQKLLFIAFDGVVPRAKVNQSRERRFKASKEKEKVEEFHKLLGIQDVENFKLNSISPGTEFLFNLCNKIKGHILSKMDSDWRHLNVIYSDCCTPGEGEQKIL